MNRDQFFNYLDFPERLGRESVSELEGLVREYPFFQAARMLYVKNLKNLDNIGFNRELRSAAAYINDRQFLFGLLNDIKITDDGYFEPRGKTVVGSDSDKSQLTEDAEILSLGPDFNKQNTETVLSGDIGAGEKSLYVRELERFIPVADLDLLLFDFVEDEKETLDFDFDGKLPEIKPGPVDRTGEDTLRSNRHKVSSRDLIDEFIRNRPGMPRPAEGGNKPGDISEDSMQESDAFMTETMAQIYLKQGYYYKALNTYEKLSLKYPEKSVYFASQIQKIKDIISNK